MMVYGVSVGYPALSVHLCQTMGAVVSSSKMLGAHGLLILLGLLIAAKKGIGIPHFYRLLMALFSQKISPALRARGGNL